MAIGLLIYPNRVRHRFDLDRANKALPKRRDQQHELLRGTVRNAGGDRVAGCGRVEDVGCEARDRIHRPVGVVEADVEVREWPEACDRSRRDRITLPAR